VHRDVRVAQLRAFLRQHPLDGLVPLAKAMLALALLEDGEPAAAERVLPSLDVVPAGFARDLATIARAQIQRLRGDPRGALALLRPLVGKLVDGPSREHFGEQITLAAAEAGREQEAIAYLDAWLKEAEEQERPVVRARARLVLRRFHAEPIQGALFAMRSRADAVGYGKDTERLLVERLTEIALERNDAGLARWLLGEGGAEGRAPWGLGEVYGESLGATRDGGTPATEALSDLAATQRTLFRVVGRTVGLLLPLRDPRLQSEAAHVLRGASWASGLSRSALTSVDATVLVREEPADPTVLGTRLDELAAEGASVIVGGLTPPVADTLVAWGQRHRVPVLTLAVPRRAETGGYAFTLGESVERQYGLLASVIVERSLGTTAIVRERTFDLESAELDAMSGVLQGRGAACERSDETVATARFPMDAWRREGVRAFFVDAAPSCVEALYRELPRTDGKRSLLLTLAAVGTTLPELRAADGRGAESRLTVFRIAAGVVPRPTAAVVSAPMVTPSSGTGVSSESSAPSPSSSENDPPTRDLNSVARFAARTGGWPEWWTALGYDATHLAARAMAPLPEDETDDAAAAQRRRDAVRAALAASRTPLWSTDGQGFDERQRIRRDLRVLESVHR
jgi:hypothetical protein